MKILRKGVLPHNVIYTGTCLRCHCQVEATYTEVTRRDLEMDRVFEELFGPDKPKPPVEKFKILRFIECSVPCPTEGCGRKIILTEKPTPASEMDRVFEELFGPDKPKPPVEKFKIVIPKNIASKIASIAEGTAKKDRCDCGVHRKSELIRRMKKLPGIREKTLSDYADEL